MEKGLLDVRDWVSVPLIMLVEFVSTTLFLLCISMSHGNALPMICGMFAAIYMADKFSGAHLNPAVTLSVYIVQG